MGPTTAPTAVLLNSILLFVQLASRVDENALVFHGLLQLAVVARSDNFEVVQAKCADDHDTGDPERKAHRPAVLVVRGLAGGEDEDVGPAVDRVVHRDRETDGEGSLLCVDREHVGDPGPEWRAVRLTDVQDEVWRQRPQKHPTHRHST